MSIHFKFLVCMILSAKFVSGNVFILLKFYHSFVDLSKMDGCGIILLIK